MIAVSAAQAQVPPDIAAQLRAIGNGVCVPETAKIYKPLQQKAPYPGVTVVRDISYGPDPRMVMDVFGPEKGGGNRPVLIFVSGGQGNKIEAPPDGDAFYDNIMLWALKNGMTGVNMQRRGGLNGGGLAWDEPAKDVGLVVDWVRKNITKYKGNPNRIFLWSSSAGNGPVSTFAAHPEISGENGPAVKGIILMSAPNFNILPERAVQPAQRSSADCSGSEHSERIAAGRRQRPQRRRWWRRGDVVEEVEERSRARRSGDPIGAIEPARPGEREDGRISRVGRDRSSQHHLV